jgi:hypothetical protein
MTAYFGLTDIGQIKAGEVLVVSAAAGAVGSSAVQIGKALGLRVVGIAGGAEKCAFVKDELGADAAIDYKNEDVGKALRQHCPDGIDVYFDNVGGDILDEVLKRLRMKARIVLCGGISQYNAEGATRGPANYLSMISSRARMEGFVIIDYMHRAEEAIAAMAPWVAAGKLKSKLDIVEGLDNFPTALRRVYSGANFGKQLVTALSAPRWRATSIVHRRRRRRADVRAHRGPPRPARAGAGEEQPLRQEDPDVGRRALQLHQHRHHAGQLPVRQPAFLQERAGALHAGAISSRWSSARHRLAREGTRAAVLRRVLQADRAHAAGRMRRRPACASRPLHDRVGAAGERRRLPPAHRAGSLHAESLVVASGGLSIPSLGAPTSATSCARLRPRRAAAARRAWCR